MTPSLFGMRIYVNPLLTEAVNVARSPSRALRRWRQGKRATNPMQPRPSTKAFILNGDTLVVHPEMRSRLVRHVPAREPMAIVVDLSTEPDRTVVMALPRLPGKSVLGSKPRFAEFMDHVCSSVGMQLVPWQRQLVAAIERTPAPVWLPPIPDPTAALMRTMVRDLMPEIERKLLGLAHEPKEEPVLDMTTIRRLLDCDWSGKPEDPRDRRTASPDLSPSSPRKEQC